MKKIVTIILAIIILMSTIVFLINNNSNKNIKGEIVNIENIPKEEYQETIHISQKNMQLYDEVIQYKITFHEDDVIDVFSYAKLPSKTLDKKVCFIMITNGEKSIIEKIDNRYKFIHLSYVPLGRIELTTPKSNFIGKLPIIYKFLNVGLEHGVSGNISVYKNDTWYITIAIIGEKDTSITIKLDSRKKSMEILQVERHSNLGFYSANRNDFNGKYYSISIWGFGSSYAKNLNKQIETNNGSVIYFASIAHRKGDVTIEKPDKVTMRSDNPKMINYVHFSNLTGTWKFNANGRTLFGWKYIISLFYIDIDPHIKEFPPL